jgi:hypothetical protein
MASILCSAIRRLPALYLTTVGDPESPPLQGESTSEPRGRRDHDDVVVAGVRVEPAPSGHQHLPVRARRCEQVGRQTLLGGTALDVTVYASERPAASSGMIVSPGAMVRSSARAPGPRSALSRWPARTTGPAGSAVGAVPDPSLSGWPRPWPRRRPAAGQPRAVERRPRVGRDIRRVRRHRAAHASSNIVEVVMGAAHGQMTRPRHRRAGGCGVQAVCAGGRHQALLAWVVVV